MISCTNKLQSLYQLVWTQKSVIQEVCKQIVFFSLQNKLHSFQHLVICSKLICTVAKEFIFIQSEKHSKGAATTAGSWDKSKIVRYRK